MQVKSFNTETGKSAIISSTVAPDTITVVEQPQQSNQTPQPSNQIPQQSNQTPQNSNEVLYEFPFLPTVVEGPPEELDIEEEEKTPIEYCNLGSIFEPLIFPNGEQSFKIEFDLRINLGRPNVYETVLVDCEQRDSGYPLVFRSQFMLRFTNLYKCEFNSK